MKIIILLVLVFLLCISIVSAHLDAGKDSVADGYLIDLGYSPSNPVSGGKVILALNLVNDSIQEVIEPESVWVRISDKDEIVFSGTFHPEAGHVSFIYVFPKNGEYEILTRFSLGDDQVETRFLLEVGGETFPVIDNILLVIVVILLIVVYLKRK